MYYRTILDFPKLTLLLVLSLIALSAYYAQNFYLDASADSLVLENDQSLKYHRAVQGRYESDDYLVITYTPFKPLFSAEILNDLEQLQNQLLAIDAISTVTSILNVPLINSPPIGFTDIQRETPTLQSSSTDITLAEQEFLNSPLYQNLLISPDGQTTAIQLNLKRDETYLQLLNRRSELREKRLNEQLTADQQQELSQVSQQFREHNIKMQAAQQMTIDAVRSAMQGHTEKAKLHLGGVPMIVADSIEFVRHDLSTFGIGVLLFVLTILAIAFRRPRWIILPILTCFGAGIITTGFLGVMNWPVTVVSSNFISLLLIITLSLTVHLIVRYRELHAEDETKSQRTLVEEMLRSKALPCFYTAITTIVAFSSLIVSGIRPVIDFGIVMAIGTAIALILAFTLFPALLVLMKPQAAAHRKDITEQITGAVGNFIESNKSGVLVAFTLLVTATVIGITHLSVENSFINYYKPTTEIYQGMALIDQKLGGTTPLEVIIDAPDDFLNPPEPDPADPEEEEYLPFMDEIADLGELGMDLVDIDLPGSDHSSLSDSYWFNSFMLEDVSHIHNYFEQLDAVGKVLSITSTMRLLEDLNGGDKIDDFFLSIIHKNLPESIKTTLLKPYLSEDGNQLRFTMRIYDSDPTLRRNDLINKIQYDLVNQFGLKPEQVHVTGMLVLYNNMLQSLFRSQILTLGFVFLAILTMFIMLFRNIKMAALTIIPNIIAASAILGLMGALGIPLDIMTITIAAIAIGIAVDNAIHYVHRFSNEFKKDQDYWGAIQRSHRSIGKAMYYTTLIIALGFSILGFSNFIPTIYFGLLTGLSMVIALAANLMLLPLLIVLIKPMKRV
ncbi:MAG: MMPL family transporter [Gammaproteobacteria bacterium]|nr:MMPL family transporter [Gammaproteobacteria bacterium]